MFALVMLLVMASLISVLMSWGMGKRLPHHKWVLLACWWPEPRKAVVGVDSVMV